MAQSELDLFLQFVWGCCERGSFILMSKRRLAESGAH
jgi:hypothetical protein